MVNIYNGIFKKEWNNAICGNMDGLRDYHAECSKADRKRQIWYDIISMSNLKKKKKIEMNLFTKQKQTHRLQNKLMVTKRERGRGRGCTGSLGLTYTHYYI